LDPTEHKKRAASSSTTTPSSAAGDDQSQPPSDAAAEKEWDAFLDALEEIFNGSIMALAEADPEREGYVMFDKDMALEIRVCLETIKEFEGASYLGVAADGNSFNLSPYYWMGQERTEESERKHIRSVFAEMLAFLYYCTCIDEDWWKEDGATGDLEDYTATIKENWEMLLKSSDLDLGLLRSDSRTHLCRLLGNWIEEAEANIEAEGNDDGDDASDGD